MNLQMPIRLIATDMDGTLLTDKPLILPETADVLRRAAEKGIVLSLASGRLPDDASFFAVDAKLPMHVIALNGAVTLVKPLGDVQEAHHLPQPTVHRITARLDEANVQYAVFGVHEVVASNDMPLSRAQMVIGTFLNRAGGRTAFRNQKQGIDAVIQDCVKVVVFSQNLPLLDDLRAFVRDTCPDADVTSSWWDNIEIVPRSASKGSALQALAKSLNIPMDEVMVFGDSDNDLSMLEAAGVSVAMGRAIRDAAERCARCRCRHPRHRVRRGRAGCHPQAVTMRPSPAEAQSSARTARFPPVSAGRIGLFCCPDSPDCP